MAAAAVPIGASLLAPTAATALGGTLGAATLASMPSWLLPAVAGAGLSGIGGLLTGQNPLKSAALGGIGGGISSAFGGGAGLSNLFGGGESADLANEAISPALKAADSTLTNPSASSGIMSGIGKFLPYAGIAGGALALDRSMAPKQVGPAMTKPLRDRPVMPLSRQAMDVDPQSYLTSGGNRSFYSDINPALQYAAKGGSIRKMANGGSSSASSGNIPIIKGPGDGQSDSIRAMLSDGEFVFSAPAVSALGNGSNDAGGRKLDKMQKTILKKHYNGGKPKKAQGLGAYIH